MDRVALVRIATAGVIAIVAVCGRVLDERRVEPSESVSFDAIPMLLDEYVGRDMHVSDNVLQVLGSDAFLLREYRREEELPVWVYLDYHRTQRLGAQIHSPINCYPGSGWTILEKRDEAFQSGDASGPGKWLHLSREGREMLVLYWYESRWGKSSKDTALKTGLIRSSLSGAPSDAALVRVSTSLADGFDAAKARILEFIEAGDPFISTELPFEGTS